MILFNNKSKHLFLSTTIIALKLSMLFVVSAILVAVHFNNQQSTHTKSKNASYACLLPASHDLNPFCYQCDNHTRAEEIHKLDAFAKEHVLASGACHEHNYSLYLFNDPIFKDVGIFKRKASNTVLKVH